MNYPKTYRSDVYHDFKEIKPGAYRTVIRYFEEFEEDIENLDFEEYFEVSIAYLTALFETGKYEKHLERVDRTIEESVSHSIRFFSGKDIYHELLFQKAASCYHTLEYARADHIFRELIRIDPSDQDSIIFLKKCLRKFQPRFVQKTRAAGVLFFLITAILICVEILVIRSLFEDRMPLVEMTRNGVFFIGWVVLVIGELKHLWNVNREVGAFVKSAQKKR